MSNNMYSDTYVHTGLPECYRYPDSFEVYIRLNNLRFLADSAESIFSARAIGLVSESRNGVASSDAYGSLDEEVWNLAVRSCIERMLEESAASHQALLAEYATYSDINQLSEYAFVSNDDTALSSPVVIDNEYLTQNTYVSEYETTSIPDALDDSQLSELGFLSGESAAAMPPAIKRLPGVETLPQAQTPSDNKQSVTTKRSSVAKKHTVANKTSGKRSWNKREHAVIEMELRRLRREEEERGYKGRGVMRDEKLWAYISEALLRRHNIHRTLAGCKYYWGRFGRKKSGFDERIKSDPNNLSTSVQHRRR
jgi:hypothetical protein